MKSLIHKIVTALALLVGSFGAALPSAPAQSSPPPISQSIPGNGSHSRPTDPVRPPTTAPAKGPHVGVAGPVIDDLVRETTETSAETAAEAFRLMAEQSDITFGYAWDGCFARAHLMIRRMEAMGLAPHRVYAYTNGEDLQVTTTLDITIRWSYHVAPALRVRVNGKVEWMVIDPSLCQQPVTIKDWLAKQRRSSLSPWPTATIRPGADPSLTEAKANACMDYLRRLDPRVPPPSDWINEAYRTLPATPGDIALQRSHPMLRLPFPPALAAA